jgi:hypothetical protein
MLILKWTKICVPPGLQFWPNSLVICLQGDKGDGVLPRGPGGDGDNSADLMLGDGKLQF